MQTPHRYTATSVDVVLAGPVCHKGRCFPRGLVTKSWWPLVVPTSTRSCNDDDENFKRRHSKLLSLKDIKFQKYSCTNLIGLRTQNILSGGQYSRCSWRICLSLDTQEFLGSCRTYVLKTRPEENMFSGFFRNDVSRLVSGGALSWNIPTRFHWIMNSRDWAAIAFKSQPCAMCSTSVEITPPGSNRSNHIRISISRLWDYASWRCLVWKSNGAIKIPSSPTTSFLFKYVCIQTRKNACCQKLAEYGLPLHSCPSVNRWKWV